MRMWVDESRNSLPRFTANSHPLLSILIHSHPFLSTLIHCYPLSSTVIHCHPLPSILIHSHPFSSTLIHSHPLSSTLIHFYPFSSTLIQTYPFSSTQRPLVGNWCLSPYLYLPSPYYGGKLNTKNTNPNVIISDVGTVTWNCQSEQWWSHWIIRQHNDSGLQFY